MTMGDNRLRLDFSTFLVVIVALAVFLALTMDIWMPHGL